MPAGVLERKPTACICTYVPAPFQHSWQASDSLRIVSYARSSKRRKAGVREYTEEAVAEARDQLARRRAEAEVVLNAKPHAALKRESTKNDLLNLTAAAKVIDVADEDLPPQPVKPPAPPTGARRRAWESYARRRRHDSLMVVGMAAKAARHEAGAWAEVKSIALLSPHDRVLAAPIDAAWIVAVGKSFGFDVSIHGEVCARSFAPPNASHTECVVRRKSHILTPFVLLAAPSPSPECPRALPSTSTSQLDSRLRMCL